MVTLLISGRGDAGGDGGGAGASLTI
jgi:hypothetical protein